MSSSLRHTRKFSPMPDCPRCRCRFSFSLNFSWPSRFTKHSFASQLHTFVEIVKETAFHPDTLQTLLLVLYFFLCAPLRSFFAFACLAF